MPSSSRYGAPTRTDVLRHLPVTVGVFACAAFVAACAARPVVIKECAPPVQKVAFTEEEVEATEGSAEDTETAEETGGVEEGAEVVHGGTCTEGELEVLESTTAESAQPTIEDGPGKSLVEGVEEFDSGGIHVILKRAPNMPVVSTGLYVRGGVTHLDESNSGIEDMMMQLVAAGGSESVPREEMLARLNAMGTVFGANAGREVSSFGLKSVRQNWDDSWKLFADAIVNPALPEDELERQRTRHVEFLKGLDENADRYVAVLGQDLLFEGHPYSVRQWGTIENIESFTREDLAAYHEQLLTKERLMLVVVGDVSRQDIEEKIAGTLGTLPDGDWTPPTLYRYRDCEGRLKTFAADTPTSYVLAFFEAPPPGHPDYYPMVVGLSLLRTRLFEKIRTKLELGYAVSAGINDLPVNYGYLYATSSYPAHALAQIYDEVEIMQDWLVNATDLDHQVEVFITDYYMDLETLSAQRNMLATAELTRGDWRYSAEFINEVRDVTPDDIRRAMKTWVHDPQVGYYGNPELLPPDVATPDPNRGDRQLLESMGLPGPQRK